MSLINWYGKFIFLNDNCVSVRISLLLVSEDQVDNKPYIVRVM